MLTRTTIDLNHCDFNHATAQEVRLLPYGGPGGGNDIVCKRHYNLEIERRRRDYPGMPRPTWESLTVYDGNN